MNRTILEYVLLFFVYASLGWMSEVAFAAYKEHRIVNRGFLNGPLCPIYGFGMVAMALFFSWLGNVNLLVVLLIGTAITTTIELVGGWVLFKVFHTRWWDYTEYKYNLGGYICLRFCIIWGIGSVVMMRGIHPVIAGTVSLLPFAVVVVLDILLTAVFAVDVGVSTAVVVGLNRQLEEIDSIRNGMRGLSDKLSHTIGEGTLSAETLLDEQLLQLTLARMEGRDDAEELKTQLTELAGRARTVHGELSTAIADPHSGTHRLLQAFPDMKSERYGEALNTVKTFAAKTRDRAMQAADTVKEKAGQAADTVKEKAGQAADTVKEKAGQAADTVKEKAGQAADTVKEKAGQAADTVKEKAGQAADTVKEKAGQAADTVKEKTGQAADLVKEKAAPMVETVKNTAGAAVDAVTETAAIVKHTIAEETETPEGRNKK